MVSDGGSTPYRCHIRTPDFAHISVIPHLAKGGLIADVSALMGKFMCDFQKNYVNITLEFIHDKMLFFFMVVHIELYY